MHKQSVKLPDGRFVIAKFRNPQPVTELHASTADFRDLGDRATLAMIGVFSIDKPCHRALRDLEARRQKRIDDDYALVDLDRKAIYRMVAAKVQRDGITTTGAYAAGCAAEDEAVARWADKLRETGDLFFEVIADPVIAATFSLEA